MKRSADRVAGRRMVAAIVSSVAVCCPSGPARSHAFGARYDLPLPLDYYLLGAGAVVVLSFAAIAIGLRSPPAGTGEMVVKRSSVPRPLAIAASAAGLGCRLFAVLLFCLILVTGLFGSRSSIDNLAPTLVWVIWWVGLAFVSALVVNLWELLNPWDTLGRWAGRLSRHEIRTPLAYPAWAGAWPAVALYAVFAWLELIPDFAVDPLWLAVLVLAYSAMTWTCMFLFGRECWLRAGEVFTLAFGVFARFAPLAFNPRTRTLVLRPFASGLVPDGPAHPSLVVFVIVMLATVSFDGFVETQAWKSIVGWIETDTTLRPALIGLQSAGFDLLKLAKTLALLMCPVLFVGAYLAFVWMSVHTGRREVPFGPLACSLVWSLVPIAIAYHLAHYVSYLLLAGQLIIPLASDPFGHGWDLFGTANRRIDISIVDARAVWYTAVVSVVVGHVIAVVLAHVTALRLYASAATALRSQIPFVVLMVLYTMTSLWILAQPIVE